MTLDDWKIKVQIQGDGQLALCGWERSGKHLCTSREKKMRTCLGLGMR